MGTRRRGAHDTLEDVPCLWLSLQEVHRIAVHCLWEREMVRWAGEGKRQGGEEGEEKGRIGVTLVR